MAVGFVTTVLIYPKAFTTSEIGLLRLLVAYATIFSKFASLGIPRVTTMMFTYFRNKEKKHNGFLFIALVTSLSGLLLSVVILLLSKELITGRGEEKSILFADYFYYIIPLLISSLLFVILDNYYKVLYNSVQGTFLKEFMQRLIILAGAIALLLGFLQFQSFLQIFLIAFFVPPFILIILLIREKQLFIKPDFTILNGELKKKMFNVGLFGILTSFSGILVLNIDSIMINSYLDLGSTGIYAITFYFGTIILIPSRSLLKISSVIIADSWKTNDVDTVNKIYFKSCLNQLIIGGLLFIGIWSNIDNIFNEHLLGSKFESGRYVIFFISLASLIQMAGGTSNMILFTSGKYKIHTYFMAVLIILLIISNMIFIPLYGITGAAIASSIAFLVFNILKYLYLKSVFGFKPYNYKTAIVILVILISFGVDYLIPQFSNFIVDIIIRSAIIAISFSFLIIIFNVSEEVNTNFRNILIKTRIIKK